jgi:hypothetical protein
LGLGGNALVPDDITVLGGERFAGRTAGTAAATIEVMQSV